MLHLDTNIAVAHLRGDPYVTNRLAGALPSVAVSSLVVAELIYGAFISTDPVRARAKLDELLSSLSVLPFEAAAAEAYGRIRASLRRKGTPMGTWTHSSRRRRCREVQLSSRKIAGIFPK